MELKQLWNIFYVIAKTNSMQQYIIQIKNGIMKHVNVSSKIIVRAKKIIVGILAYVLVGIPSI